MVPEQALITKIEAFLEATNTNPTQFGVDAINDGKLVPELKEGRQLRKETRDRVEAHITDKIANISAKLSRMTDDQSREVAAQ